MSGSAGAAAQVIRAVVARGICFFPPMFSKPILYICPALFPAAATAGCRSPIKGSKGQPGDQQGSLQMQQLLLGADQNLKGIRRGA